MAEIPNPQEHLPPSPPARRRGGLALHAAFGGLLALAGGGTAYNLLQADAEREDRRTLQAKVEEQRDTYARLLQRLETEKAELQGTFQGQKRTITTLHEHLEQERQARADLEERFGQAWKEGQEYFQRDLKAGAALEERLAKNEEQSRLLKQLVTRLDGELTVSELHDIIQRTQSCVVAIGPIDNPASGFSINDCQFIVTNQHVTGALAAHGYAKDGQYPIALHTGNRGEEPFTFSATLEKVGGRGTPLKDAESSSQGGSDLSILRVPESVRRSLPKWVRSMQLRDTARRPIRSGEVAIAVGNPRGLRSSVNVGRVSQGERHFSIGPRGPNPLYPVIQMDADLNGGNSGGPTVDSKGELIGISFYRYGPGLSHTRHVLNLKAVLEENGIATPISREEREMLGRWAREHAAIRAREEVQRKAAEEQSRRTAEERRLREEAERKKREEEQKQQEREVEKRMWNSIHR